MRSGDCTPLPKPVRHISEGDGGVWHIPTPTVSDLYTQNLASTQQKEHTNHSVTLAQWANRYPTPSTMDYINRKHMRPSRAATNRKTGYLSEAVPGELNPDWIEWLMGLPIGWTASEPLATGSYQQWLRGFSHDDSV